MKATLLYLLSFAIFIYLFSSAYVGRPLGPDQHWYQQEMELVLESGNPLQIDYNRVFEAGIDNEELAYLPIHHSLYHVLMFPFSKLFGTLHGILIGNFLATLIGVFFITKSTFLITKNHLYSAIVWTLVLLFPLIFRYAIHYLQEIYFFAFTSIIIFFYLKSFYATPNSKEELFNKISMYVICCVAILLYPVFLMTLFMLLFFDMIISRKKTIYLFAIFGISGLLCLYLSGFLFNGLVGKLLFTNILYGEKGPATMGGLYVYLTESFQPITWFLFRVQKFLSGIFAHSFAIIFSSIAFFVIALNTFLVCKFPNKKNFKIFTMLLSFALAIFAMQFLSQYLVRYMLYMLPALVISFVYCTRQMPLFQKIKKSYLQIPFGILFLLFIALDLLAVRTHQKSKANELIVEVPYLEKFSPRVNAGDKLLILVKNLENHEIHRMASSLPLTVRIFVPFMENSQEDVILRANKFSPNKILISEELNDYVKDICSNCTRKNIIEINGINYLYFERD